MCYICNCFAWTLDLIQRAITFGLACCLMAAVCVGLTVAIAAGMAYGYNYCLAEFVTFSKSDVTVYMRRGQFYDQPELDYRSRRSGGGDLFSSNSTDYQDQKAIGDTKPLQDSWLKAQDTRKYAEKLAKFSNDESRVYHEPAKEYDQRGQYSSFTEPPRRIISHAPHSISVIMTTSWNSGVSEIVMRRFQPIADYTMRANVPKEEGKSLEYEDNSRLDLPRQTIDVDRPRKPTTASQLLKRLWDARKSDAPIGSDYVVEDVDEDTVLYKPMK